MRLTVTDDWTEDRRKLQPLIELAFSRRTSPSDDGIIPEHRCREIRVISLGEKL